MTKFIHNTFATILCMIIGTAVILFLGYQLAQVKAPLLPITKSKIPWQADIEPDAPKGKTQLNPTKESKSIEYDFFLSSGEKYPYTGYNLNFINSDNNRKLVDLSSYQGFSFEVTCNPRNILLLVLFTFDEKTTDLHNPETYRVNWHFFTCDRYWESKRVSLEDFETPDWWLQNSGLELVDRDYDLTQVIGFGFINSLQSPRGVPSNTKLSSLALTGTNWIFIYIAIALVSIMWVVFLRWALKRYIQMVIDTAKQKMRDDLPLTAYQKLSISSQKDNSKRDLLMYLATEYANPNLNMDITAEKLGLNRNKINEILKEELGLTFTSYINKLRLTEAARLLSVHKDENISQIAYKVGFNNVTYFNKLFKNAYGCTPKRFKDNFDQPQSEP